MTKRILLALIFITTISLYSNESFDKVLIREYYNLLETKGSIIETYNMTNWEISFETYKTLYNDVESIQLEKINLVDINTYEAYLHLKKYGDETLLYKTKIIMEDIEGVYRGIKSISSKLQDNNLPRNMSLIIKYYEYMERPSTLEKAYHLSKKDYSLEKFKSWYTYNRAYIDLQYVSMKDNKYSYIVNFEEDYLGQRQFYKYSVILTIQNGLIIKSESKQLKVEKKNYQFRFIDKKLVCGSIMSSNEVVNYLYMLDGSLVHNIEPIYQMYRYCYSPEVVTKYISKALLKGYGNDANSMIFWQSEFDDITNNDAGILKLLLDSGMSPNARAWELYSTEVFPINLAVRSGNIFVLKYILSKGVKKSTNALFDSLKINRLDLFDILIESGIDINQSHIEDGEGHSFNSNSLCYAINKNDIELIFYLLNHDVDINKGESLASGWDISMEEYEFNPTAFAIYKGRFDILKLLLLYGADEPEGSRSIKFYTNVRTNELVFPSLNINYYSWDVKPNIFTEIYTEDGQYFIKNTKTDVYTSAELSNEKEVIEMLKLNNIKPNFIETIEEITVK